MKPLLKKQAKEIAKMMEESKEVLEGIGYRVVVVEPLERGDERLEAMFEARLHEMFPSYARIFMRHYATARYHGADVDGAVERAWSFVSK